MSPHAGTILLFSPLFTTAEAPAAKRKPIVLDSSGGFTVGGSVIASSLNENLTLSCDHGYMEYFLPWSPRKTSLVMWHSSGAQTFQNRFDGGEGYKDMFLRRDYPVYLWEGPRIGRANWPCEPTIYIPAYRDQGNFVAWNLGPAYGHWWPDTQFPKDNAEAWNQATRSRYPEYDTEENLVLHASTAAIAADSGKIGSSIVYLTNSAACIRAILTATTSNSTNIKGIVAYEWVGAIIPDSATDAPTVNFTGAYFGPKAIPVEDFKKFARLKAVQFVWGDHRGADGANNTLTQFVEVSRYIAKTINYYGGNAEVIMLGDEFGLKGSTHIAFADMDNDKVGALLEDFLNKNGLDGYA